MYLFFLEMGVAKGILHAQAWQLAALYQLVMEAVLALLAAIISVEKWQELLVLATKVVRESVHATARHFYMHRSQLGHIHATVMVAVMICQMGA